MANFHHNNRNHGYRGRSRKNHNVEKDENKERSENKEHHDQQEKERRILIMCLNPFRMRRPLIFL